MTHSLFQGHSNFAQSIWCCKKHPPEAEKKLKIIKLQLIKKIFLKKIIR